MKFIYCLGAFVLIGCVAADGFGSSSEDSAEEAGRCFCGKRTCTGVTGTKVIGCPNTNSTLQCSGTTCAVIPCPPGQVWSSAKNACSACDADKHIAANGQVCVCNQGFTFSRDANKTCVSCPTGANTTNPDRCFCPPTTVLDKDNNACKPCPTDATLKFRQCVCNDLTVFFSWTTWTCTACPGTLVAPRRAGQRSSCKCTGANAVFIAKSVTCYTCPAATPADADGDECQCPRRTGLEFDYKSGTCVCDAGYTKNASGVCTKTAA